MKSYISKDPQILGGMPVIAGTRVPMARIIFLLKEGYTIGTIHDEYPHVPLRTIEGAVTQLVRMLEDSKHASKVL